MIADDKGNMKQSSKTYTRGKKSTRTDVNEKQKWRIDRGPECTTMLLAHIPK